MINGLLGGVLIGLAAGIMMLFNGRITGISGIIGTLLRPQKNEAGWRLSFIGGLLVGGFILKIFKPDSFIEISSAFWFDYIFAGLFVGYGTLLGSGCTSGHGVCGISRLSMRSIIATLVFITFGVISVTLFKFLRGSL